jgi:hypothetical protein
MTPQEMDQIGVHSLTDAQKQALFARGIRMYGLGQHTVGDIDSIKYDGKLILLDDGSRWEVDSLDADTANFWSELDKVVVIDDVMYCIEDSEQVSVQQDYD